MCEKCTSLVGCQPHLCAIQKEQLPTANPVILSRIMQAEAVVRATAAIRASREHAAELMALASA